GDFRVVGLHRRGNNHDVRACDVFRLVAFKDRCAKILQPLGDRGELGVRTGNRIAQREQNFGDAAHADAADADHVNALKIAKRYHHARSGSFRLAGRAASSIKSTISRAAPGWAWRRADIAKFSISRGWSRREKISRVKRSAVSSCSGITRPAPAPAISCALRNRSL